jgi:hypothetical protein
MRKAWGPRKGLKSGKLRDLVKAAVKQIMDRVWIEIFFESICDVVILE